MYNPVDFPKMSKKNNNRVFNFHTVSLFWSIFYTAYDVQAVIHDVQDKTRHFARCITGFTQFSTRLTGQSTGRLHDLQDVYMMCTLTRLMIGSTRSNKTKHNTCRLYWEKNQ